MITSKGNAWFKRVRDAVREHTDEIAIEGPKAVNDAIAAGWKPIATPSFSPQLLRSISDTKTSQGVIGLFERPRWNKDQILSRKDAIVVALDGVQDPGNVGTIVRLVAAFAEMRKRQAFRFRSRHAHRNPRPPAGLPHRRLPNGRAGARAESRAGRA